MVSIASIILPDRQTDEGRRRPAFGNEITRALGNDWSLVPNFTPEEWEHIVAGYYHNKGFRVTITPRSGDLGRDLIARMDGFGSLKVLGSVKRFAPHRPVSAEAALSLLGAVDGDPSASKGVLVTTSTFAPRILKNPAIANATPTRLQLIDGDYLQRLLAGKDSG